MYKPPDSYVYTLKLWDNNGYEFGCILASICRKTLYITYIYMHIRYYNTLKPKKLQI